MKPRAITLALAGTALAMTAEAPMPVSTTTDIIFPTHSSAVAVPTAEGPYYQAHTCYWVAPDDSCPDCKPEYICDLSTIPAECTGQPEKSAPLCPYDQALSPEENLARYKAAVSGLRELGSAVLAASKASFDAALGPTSTTLEHDKPYSHCNDHLAASTSSALPLSATKGSISGTTSSVPTTFATSTSSIDLVGKQ